jgi:hypothetical protein
MLAARKICNRAVLRLVSAHIEHLRADLNLSSEQKPSKNLRDIFGL